MDAPNDAVVAVVRRVGLVATLLAAVTSCAAQPVAPRRGLLQPGAIPLVSHLESPLRIAKLNAAVNGAPILRYEDPSGGSPLPAYVVLPPPRGDGTHHLSMWVEVVLPCFSSDQPAPTEWIRVMALFTYAARPTRIELYHDAAARSTGRGVHVRVVGALRVADLEAGRGRVEAALRSASEPCVRDLLRSAEAGLGDTRARCDVEGFDFCVDLLAGLQRRLSDLPDGPTRAAHVASTCEEFARLRDCRSGSENGFPECPWGERRRAIHACDYLEHDTPPPSSVSGAPSWP